MNVAETMQVELTREPVRDVAAFSTWRLMLWQVRKEIWEHRGLWVAPAATAAVVLVMWVGGLIYGLSGRAEESDLLQGFALTGAFTVIGALMGLVVFFVAAQFCLDALYGERRERTVLFWKSMPVSDEMTVVSKFAVPMLVVPVIGLVLTVVLNVLLWATAILVLLGSHVSATGAIHAGLVPSLLLDAYAAVMVTLWYAPIYALLLLISVLSKKMPLTWAVVPPVVLMVMEKMIWHTVHVAKFLGWLFVGAQSLAWGWKRNDQDGWDRLHRLTPGAFFSSPHLWIGLIVAAGMLMLAARVRRSQITS